MEENNIKLWGLVNVFTNLNDVIIYKGSVKSIHNRYGTFNSLIKGAVFELKPFTNWYFRDLDKEIEQFESLEIKIPNGSKLLYHSFAGQRYLAYNIYWDVIAVRILNELEFFDYVYHN